MHALRQLLPRWTDEATNPLPPETPSAVEQVFRHLGFAATADVLALYGTLGGMRVMDNEYWRLWSFAEVAEQVPSESGILFSDYLMSSWDYRLKPISPEHSTVYVDHYDGVALTIVANSLEKFFEYYLTNARELLDP